MASTLAWMDFAADDQRRMREIVQLFTVRESRDELGLGVVRDAFSDRFFPGVSTVHTRARYFLFIPWTLQAGLRTSRRGPELLSWVRNRERDLIEHLRAGGDTDGLIGVEAGRAIKVLPSTIYWSSLQRYGIVRWPDTMERLVERAGRAATIEDALTEQIDRSDGPWDPNMPTAPPGFGKGPMTFEFTSEESVWFRETLQRTCPGSLMAWMVERHYVPSDNSPGPWAEPWRSDLPPELGRLVAHAERFGLLVHGAALLYNELLGRRAEQMKLGKLDGVTEGYHAALTTWSDCAASIDWTSWDIAELWEFVAEASPLRIHRLKGFVDAWLNLVRRRGTEHLWMDHEACELVANRERTVKGTQSRLTNDRMMTAWNGASGAGALDYRWGQARRMMTDIEAGCSHVGA